MELLVGLFCILLLILLLQSTLLSNIIENFFHTRSIRNAELEAEKRQRAHFANLTRRTRPIHHDLLSPFCRFTETKRLLTKREAELLTKYYSDLAPWSEVDISGRVIFKMDIDELVPEGRCYITEDDLKDLVTYCS